MLRVPIFLIVTVGLSLMMAFATCILYYPGLGCLVSGAWFRVVGSRCLVSVSGIHCYLLETVRL